MGGGAASAAVVEEGPGESPMREGWLACNFLLASERVGAPALRTTIAHSVTPKRGKQERELGMPCMHDLTLDF